MRKFDHNGLLLATYQAEIFEKSTELKCSSPIFLRRFLHSDYLKLLDKNESMYFALDPFEGIEMITEQYGDSAYGKIKYSKDSMFWMGYMYRYISYTREEPTSFIMKTFDYRLMNDVYHSFHTQDPEWVIASLLDIKHLNEDYLDKNKRLKKILKRRYENDPEFQKVMAVVNKENNSRK